MARLNRIRPDICMRAALVSNNHKLLTLIESLPLPNHLCRYRSSNDHIVSCTRAQMILRCLF